MRRRGFTLLEAMLVSAVLALLASLVAPRLVAFQDSQRTLRDSQTIETIAEQAHSAAVRDRVVYVLTYDDTTNALKYEAEEAELATGETTSPTEQTLLNPWTVSDVSKGSSSETTSDFSVRFFGDGTAEATTASFTQNGVVFGLVITKEGNVTVNRGAPTVQDQSEWEAGDLEQKTTT
jgi:prepilin-type N-terminal cleavage/methylation domain-containing protein